MTKIYTKEKRPKAPDPLFILRPHGAEIQSTSFLPRTWLDGLSSSRHEPSIENLLVSGDLDGTVSVWDISTRRVCASWQAHAAGVLATVPLPSGCLLTHGRDGLMRIWDLNDGCRVTSSNKIDTPMPMCTMSMYTGGHTFCKASLVQSVGHIKTIDVEKNTDENVPFNSLLAAPSTEASNIVVWNIQEGKIIRHFSPASEKLGMCMSVKILANPSGMSGSAPLLVAAFESGDICVIDFGTGKTLLTIPLQNEPLLCLSMNRNGNGGICGGTGTKLQHFSFDYQTEVTPIINISPQKCVKLPTSGISDISLRSDNRVFATGGWDGAVRIFQYWPPKKMRSPKPLAVLETHVGTVSSVSWSDDCKLLACGGRDKTISMWSIYPPKTSTKK